MADGSPHRIPPLISRPRAWTRGGALAAALALITVALCGRGSEISAQAPSDGGDSENALPVIAVAELYAADASARSAPGTSESAHRAMHAYPLLPSTRGFAWPEGAADGGLDSGIGMLLLPHLGRGLTREEPVTRLAVLNLAQPPGFTDLVLYIFDANGLLDYVCQKLNERQVEYIDLDLWGYINPGLRGHAVISAWYWEHDVFDEAGFFQRNTMGLAATLVEAVPVGAEGIPMLGLRGAIPLDLGASRERGDTSVSAFPPLCPSQPFPPRRGQPPTPDPRHSPTPTPSPTATRTPWPTPRAPASAVEHAPALRFLAAGRAAAGSGGGTGEEALDCPSTMVVYNPGPKPARLLLVAQPLRPAGEPGAEPPAGSDAVADCARDFVVQCTGLLPPHKFWRWRFAESLDGSGAALTILSLDERPLRADGIDAPGSHADLLCATVSAQLAAGCLRWSELLEAWRGGTAFLPLPTGPGDPAGAAVLTIRPGPPVFAERWLECDEGRPAAVSSALAGNDLGWAAPVDDGEDDVGDDGGDAAARNWSYGLLLPSLAASSSGDPIPPDGEDSAPDDAATVLALVQAATGLAGSVEIAWQREADGAPLRCGRWSLPGGGARAIDLSRCVRRGLDANGAARIGAAGALRFAADVPVAIVVDVQAPAGESAGRPGGDGEPWTSAWRRLSLPASPLLRHDPRSRPDLHADDRVAYAPLLYHGVDGWHSRLRLHNPDPERLARFTVEVFDRRGALGALRILGRVRPGETHSISLDDLPELPPDVYWARVRSVLGSVAPTRTPGPPPPLPTGTATAEPPPPSATATATTTARVPGRPRATPTVAAGSEPTRVWLPVVLRRH